LAGADDGLFALEIKPVTGEAIVSELQNARINTAGAYVSINGLYPFAIGAKLYNGCIPVVRLGGHREEQETGWQCAAREAFEEARLRIRPLRPPTTYLANGDHLEAALEEIRWVNETDQENVPLLVVAYHKENEILLSLMYLAQADEFPIPASEVEGLLLLDKKNIHRLCEESLTLAQYLESSGQAVLNDNFDRSLILEPFAQLRLFSRILTIQSKNLPTLA
jgi:ADP-ribose pyrophosphatase YjhB (NUDIX family)